jgi:hypothetical protein
MRQFKRVLRSYFVQHIVTCSRSVLQVCDSCQFTSMKLLPRIRTVGKPRGGGNPVLKIRLAMLGTRPPLRSVGEKARSAKAVEVDTTKRKEARVTGNGV